MTKYPTLYAALRYTLLLMILLTTAACSDMESSDHDTSTYEESRYEDSKYDASRYETSKYDIDPTRLSSDPPIGIEDVVIDERVSTPSDIATDGLVKEEIARNRYETTDARQLTGIQSIKYDVYFRSAMSWQMPQIDWRWLKALCWQESRFNPRAVSPVGAGGVCQFMPGTFEGVPEAIREGRDVWDAQTNITAAAWYLNTRYRFWTSPRPQLDRIRLAQACYNAGCGHVLNAQKACDMAITYDGIIECLPSITGHHSKETIGYVRFIDGFRRDLGVPDPVSY